MKTKTPPPKNKIMIFLGGIYKYHSLFWSIFGPVLTIITILYTFYPHIEVRPIAMMQTSNPLSTRFEIKNNSYFSLDSVEVLIIVKHIEAIQKSGHKFHIKGMGVIVGDPINNFKSKQSITKTFEMFEEIPLKKIRECNISVEISYNVPLIPKDFSESYSFKLMINSDGIKHWIPTF